MVHLGHARNIASQWELMHYIDLQPIINNYIQNKNTFLKFFNSTRNICKNVQNYAPQILENELQKTEILINEIIPETSRFKRGLFNFIGTVEKTLTGVLDADDGERYERNFKNLFNNQQTLKLDFENQLSLNKNFIKKVNNTIFDLSKNQKELAVTITTLSSSMSKFETTQLCVFTESQTALSLIHFEQLNSLLMDISIMQTFSRHSQFHTTMLKPNELLNELKTIQKYLPPEISLMIEPNLQTLPIFEKMIQVKTYQTNTKLYFILTIPLTYKTTFDYIKLFPLPNKNKQIILPKGNYLLSNGQSYALTNQPCQLIVENQYICEIEQITTSDLCVKNLIKHNSDNCKKITLSQFNNQIIKIKEISTYLLIMYDLEKLQIECTDRPTILKRIIGNYLLTIDSFCKVTIGKNILIPTHKTITKPNIYPLFELQMFNISNKQNKLKVNLTKINFGDINEIYDQVEFEENRLKTQTLLDLETDKMIWTTYVIPIIIIILFLLILIYCYPNYKKLLYKLSCKSNNVKILKTVKDEQTTSNNDNINLGNLKPF